MEAISIKEILDHIDGELICGDENVLVTSVCIDSKKVSKGALFVPIRGQKVDAHDYIESAFENGAVATFTQSHIVCSSEKAYIRVDDTRIALQQLAEYYRSKFDIKVIGVTGSAGKTTTKEMIYSVVSQEFEALKTEGNANGQIGVPMTMFDIESKHKVAVVEMGISEFSEMERIAKIAKPDIVVITNIGITHIENLESQENILKEKLHIADYVIDLSKIFVNGDNDLLSKINIYLENFKKENNLSAEQATASAPDFNAEKDIGKVNYFGFSNRCNIKAGNIHLIGESTGFDLVLNDEETIPFIIPTLGEHNVSNALVAIGIGLELGISMEKIKEGFSKYKTPAMRQIVCRCNNIVLIDDTYNASPDSMKSSVDVLMLLGGQESGRSIAVLADMLELGDESIKSHLKLGRYIADSYVDCLITVGERAKDIVKGALENKSKIHVKSFDSNQEAILYLQEFIKGDDVVLFKGSRGMHTEEILHSIQNYFC